MKCLVFGVCVFSLSFTAGCEEGVVAGGDISVPGMDAKTDAPAADRAVDAPAAEASPPDMQPPGDKAKCVPQHHKGCCGKAKAVCWFDSCGKQGKLLQTCKHGCAKGKCTACQPACKGKQCGADGCGGSCGKCSSIEDCTAGKCVYKKFTLTSRRRGTVYVRPGHDYGPAIINDNGAWRMWWCGSPSKAGASDSIWYAVSKDGYNWSCPKEVLLVTAGSLDASAVCDPSVVKKGLTYYLYYTGINTKIDHNNRVFVATSKNPDGAWTKYPSNASPKAILSDKRCDKKNPNDYCVGQSSVIYHAGKFWHWYTNTGAKKLIPKTGDRPVMLATSTNGITFKVVNGGKPVFDHGSVDVKYDVKSKKFLMVYGEVNDNKIYWSVSNDGVTWLPHSKARAVATKLSFKENHNPGMAGSVTGTFNATTFVTYGAGTGWGIWDMDTSDVRFNVSGAVKDCSKCSSDCSLTCSKAGFGKAGFCGKPGSTNPKACCTCVGKTCPKIGSYCAKCLVGAKTCVVACKGAGYSSGYCGKLGSTNPSNCCTCIK